MANSDDCNVLLAPEAEGYVMALQPFPIDEIGSPRWNLQHEYLEQLHRQAILSAKMQGDEFVKEFLITHDKLPFLVYDLIVTECWKNKVFPELKSFDLNPSFPVYLVLYHEAVILTLLETILFHSDTAEAMGDSIMELVDYCYRQLTHHLATNNSEEDESEEEQTAEDRMKLSVVEELERQEKSINFDLVVLSASVLHYIVLHLEHMPLSVTSQVLDVLDIPLLLVSLVESPPWIKETDGKLKKYQERKWEEFTSGERWKVSRTEGQMWIALYQLLLMDHTRTRYEITDHRKNTLLKLRGYLNEVVLDQIPCLVALLQYLQHLSIMEAQSSVKRGLIIEQTVNIKENILNKFNGKWKKLAKKQHQQYFDPSKVDKDFAKRLVDMYTNEFAEDLLANPPRCVQCGELAAKRCSRCKEEWYCGRECQVKHWKKHKAACDLVLESKAEKELVKE